MSSAVQAGVLAKIQDLLPNQIGTNRRWAQADVERHIMYADGLIRERVGNLYHQQEITLLADTREYAIDSEFIDIVSVEYALDGSTYDWYLKPLTLDDLDKISVRWRQDGGDRPRFYTLLGAPGVPTSKIQIYQPPTASTGSSVRVTGIGSGATTTTCSDDIQNKCHVPHVMAVLLAKSDPKQAANWFGKYQSGVEEVRRRTLSKLSKGSVDVRIGW